MKAAVVILNWNGVELLQRFLPSVVNYTKIPDVSVYIADNNSSDNSISFVQKNFPTVKIITLDDNYGFAGGYNHALEKIDAEYYILLNSDVEVTPNWLQPLINLMSSDSQIAACMPKILSYRNKDEFEYAGAAGGFLDKYGFSFCRGRLFNVIEKDEGQYDYTSEIFWASGACMVVRANLYHQLGGLDIDFFAHMEEIDLCWRLKNTGYKIMYSPLSKIYHLGGATLKKTNPQKTYLNFRNNLFLLYKNLPKNKVFAVLVIRLFLDGIAALKFLTGLEIKNFISVFKAHYSFYTRLKKFKTKRQQNLNIRKKENYNGIYSKSLVFKFFLKKVKVFSDLELDKFGNIME